MAICTPYVYKTASARNKKGAGGSVRTRINDVLYHSSESFHLLVNNAVADRNIVILKRYFQQI